jgi:hypothetical protein
MSIDARVLLASPREKVIRTLVRQGTSRDAAALMVRAVGSTACTVSSPFWAPDDESTELIAWTRALVVPSLGHRDPRGVLAFSEELELRARTYDGSVDAIGREGFWLSLEGDAAPKRSKPAPAKKRPAPRAAAEPAPFAPEKPGPQWACLVIRPPTRVGERHPGAHHVERLGDGTAVVVVKELYRDVESLVNMLDRFYPELAGDAAASPGLLVLPKRAYAEAVGAASYDELAATYGARAIEVRVAPPKSAPPAMWLRLDRVTALRGSFRQ